MATRVRAVVTGHEAGRAVFRADGEPGHAITLPGATVWPLLRLDALPGSADAGDPAPAAPAPLPPGGLSVQLVDLEAAAGGTWPDGGGWRRVDTLDLVVVVTGTLLVGLDAGELTIGAGDTLVLRGARHRMRAAGEPVRMLVTHLAPGAGDPQPLDLRQGTDGGSGVRRVVAATVDGRSGAVHDGEPGLVFRPAGRAVLTDTWQTGGPVVTVDQGGDADAPWQVEPVHGGVAARIVELPPGDYGDDANWHTTSTIDVDVILSGAVELHLPELPPALLGPGDVVVQRGTHHRWQPVGDAPMRMAAVMIPVV